MVNTASIIFTLTILSSVRPWLVEKLGVQMGALFILVAFFVIFFISKKIFNEWLNG